MRFTPWDVYRLWRGLKPFMTGPKDTPLGVECSQNFAVGSWKRARVSVDRNTLTWSPEGATVALVVPVSWEDCGAMMDLVAIDPKENEAYRLTGDAIALGQARLEDPSAEKIAYHETPMDWVKDHGRGVCPLDEAFFTYVVGIGDITLVADSVESGKRLDAWLRRAAPQLPTVAVRRAALTEVAA